MKKILLPYLFLFKGFRDSFEVLGQIVYKFMTSKLGLLKVAILGTLLLMVLYISFNFVDLFIASQDAGTLTEASQLMFESILLVGTYNGGLTVLSGILWGGLIASITLPIVSNSLLSSYNRSTMVSIKNNDVYKITDSIILQYVSILTIVQLFVLIIFFNVLKYTYQLDNTVYLMAFTIWLFFGLVSNLLSWVMDYILRKYGAIVKFTFVGLEAALLGYVFFLLPNVAENFFGVAPIIVDALQDNNTKILFLVASLLFGFVLMGLIMYFGLVTINTTAPFISTKKAKEHRFTKSTMWLMVKVLMRNGNVKSPIIIMFFVILTSIVMSGDSPTLFAFIFALPMVITMSSMINMYGIAGSGNSWLFSVTKYSTKSLAFFALYNLMVSTILVGLLSLSAYALGIIPAFDSTRFFLSSMIAALIMTVFASWYSYNRPNKYDVHVRGENILPPSKSLVVLCSLIIIGGLPGIYAFAFLNIYFLTGALLVTALGSLLALILFSKNVAKNYKMNDIISATA